MFSLVHNHFLANMGVNAGCACFELKEADELPVLMHFLERFGFKGLSVAAPLKYEITQFLAEVDESARKPGLANTIWLGRDGWVGHNTEVYGFSRLMELEDIEPKGEIIIFGAGGAAAAVLCALEDRGVRDATIVSRSEGNVSALLEQFPEMNLTYSHYDNMRRGIRADIVINTIPMDWGNTIWRERFWPLPAAAFWERMPSLAIDLQYSPWETNFLSLWDDARKINGYHMFVEQSAKAFEVWHSVSPIYDPIVLKDFVKNAVDGVLSK